MLERCCEDEDTVQRAALSSCLVQHVLLTMAVELPPEIPYCPPNAMDVADPHATHSQMLGKIEYTLPAKF